MKRFFFCVLVFILVGVLTRCEDMDSQYAIKSCPPFYESASYCYYTTGKCRYGGGNGSPGRLRGCVQQTYSSCYDCDPAGDDVAVAKLIKSDEIIASTSSEDVEVKPIYSTPMDSTGSLSSDALFGKEKALSYTSGSCEIETFARGYLDRYYHESVSGNNYKSQAGSRVIKPTGNDSIDLSSGTLSFWLNLRTVSSVNNMRSQAGCSVFGIDKSVMQLYFSSNDSSDVFCNLYINNKVIISKKVGYNNGWFHVYIVWGNELQDSKTMRIFIDKNEVITYSESLPDMSAFNFITSLDGYVLAHGDKKCKKILGVWKECKKIEGGTNSSVSMSKLKLWDSIVSEDPEAEYNN